ncbi:uncharacterized protein LOC135492484 [Lineus longissimus]|uniref:uncharacterized protein LOC135492484 n=1 Tax=Lineus longissimus TaxID=88925 RepID=UPI002B4E160C
MDGSRINRRYALWIILILIIASCLGLSSAAEPKTRTGAMLSSHMYVEETPEIVNTTSMLNSLCRLHIKNDGIMEDLTHLIINKKKKFIEIKLKFPRGVDLDIRNYSKITELDHWFWVDNHQGKPLLELDFRFYVLSVTSLSIDVASVDADVRMEPRNCLNKMHLAEKTHLIQDMLMRHIHQIVGGEGREDTSSAVCYSRLATYKLMLSKHYVQKFCCDIPLYQGAPWSCEAIVSSYTNTYVVILYIVLFLVSPLLIKFLPQEEVIYTVDDDGRAHEMVKCKVLYGRQHSTLPQAARRINTNNNNNLPGFCLSDSRDNYRNDNLHNGQKDIVAPACRSPERPADVESVCACTSGVPRQFLRIHSHESQNDSIMRTSMLSQQSSTFSQSLQSLHETLKAFEFEIYDSNGNPEKLCNGLITNHKEDGNEIHQRIIPVRQISQFSDLTLTTQESQSGQNTQQRGTELPISLELEQNEANICAKRSGCQYSALDNTTPIRICTPLYYIFLLHVQNDWICRIRRINFFWILFPIFIHGMVIGDIMLYHDHITHLYNMERRMGIVGDLADLENYDYIWLGAIFTNPELVIGTVYLSMYFLMTVVLVIEGNLAKLLNKLMVQDHYLGCMKLPKELRTPKSENKGMHLLYHKMKFRLCLIAEPRFWVFWFKQLRLSLWPEKSEGCKSCCKALICRPIRFFTCIASLALLFPLTNFFPWDMVIDFFSEMKETDKFARSCLRRYKKRQYGKAFLFLTCAGIIILGLLFALLIFIYSCKIVSLFILYTIKGVIKHYMETLPIISIKVVALYYLLSTTHKLKLFYKEVKKQIFELCVEEQKEMNEKEKELNAKQALQEVNDQEVQEDNKIFLVAYRKDGIPLIPKQLYNKIFDRHCPLREHELAALAKLMMIAIFLFYVGSIINIYQIGNISSLGQAIATFFAVTLPKLFDFFSGKDAVEDDILKYKIKHTIREYVETTLINGDDDDDKKAGVDETLERRPNGTINNCMCVPATLDRETQV